MHSYKAVKVGFMLAAIGAAALSHGQIVLLLASHGDAADIGGNIAEFQETVDGQTGGPELDDLEYFVNLTTGAGIGEYFGVGGTLSFNLQYDPTSLKSVAPGQGSIDGNWYFTGGTGGYAGYTAGKGTLALSYLIGRPGTASTATSFVGILTPEPAPFLALGAGALGLMVRRRRKA